MTKKVAEEVEITISVFRKLLESEQQLMAIEAIGMACGEALAKGRKILLAGNGGSAADSQHLAAEFVSRLEKDRLPLAALALTTDTSILTAVGNDYGYEHVFQRQIDAIASEGDVLIAISTSGNSPSILEGLRAAKAKGVLCVGFTGETGGLMANLCDLLLKVPSARTRNIQEVHIMAGHTVCAVAEEVFFKHTQQLTTVC